MPLTPAQLTAQALGQPAAAAQPAMPSWFTSQNPYYNQYQAARAQPAMGLTQTSGKPWTPEQLTQNALHPRDSLASIMANAQNWWNQQNRNRNMQPLYGRGKRGEGGPGWGGHGSFGGYGGFGQGGAGWGGFGGGMGGYSSGGLY